MVPIIPDLGDLPTIVRIPHARKMPFIALVVSGIWMMLSAFSPVWLPMLWPDMSVTTQVILTFIPTAAALGGGTVALRRYASEDEVTIDDKQIRLRIFTWFGVKKKSFDWQEIARVEKSLTNGYAVLELVLKDENEPVIPVYVARDEHRADSIKTRLEKFINTNAGQATSP